MGLISEPNFFKSTSFDILITEPQSSKDLGVPTYSLVWVEILPLQ